MPAFMTTLVMAAVVGTSTISVWAMFDQVLYCLLGNHRRKELSKRLRLGSGDWVPSTEGISAFDWLNAYVATVLWLIYGWMRTPPDLALLLTMGPELCACGAMLVALTWLSPRRSWLMRLLMMLALLGTFLSLGPLRSLVQESVPWKWFPLFSTLAMVIPGKLHQCWITFRRGNAGRLTVLKVTWSVIDWGLWVAYGLLIGDFHVWFPSLVAMLPVVLLAALVLRDKSKVEEFLSETHLGKLLSRLSSWPRR
ncbi:MAG: hypothetical protein KDD44_08785 [Bdellovibrionales bacterium]|nr:hypothetical protein [Bdellovibrionales bacterium]